MIADTVMVAPGGAPADVLTKSATKALKDIAYQINDEEEVAPGRYCPPRHPTHFDPSFLGLNGVLRRSEQYLPGPRRRRRRSRRSPTRSR